MKNKVEFTTISDDTKIYNVNIEVDSRNEVEAQLQVLADFQKRYKNEKCEYSTIRREFKPVLAVFYSFVYGWETGFKVCFFDKNMLNDSGIEHGFFDEPKNDAACYTRTIYDIKNNKLKINKCYKLETE